MRKLDKPLDAAGDIFTTCISRVRDADLKARLTACRDNVISVSNEFETKVSNASLHTIVASNNINGNVSVVEMEKVYTGRMAKKNAPGRAFYDKIISLPKHGRCPLCNHRNVSTLDHHLAKSLYPELVVAPVNLVPSCSDCNKIKTDKRPSRSNEETIHPYFDDIENELWLKARVIEGSPPSIEFFADPPEIWNATLSDRVHYHFRILELATLYASNAAEDLENIRHSLNRLFVTGGVDSVCAYLIEARDSRINNQINSWQTAMYSALAESYWFCNEGFNA